MAQTCPPGPATGLQAQDKAAEAKTRPAVGSGGATAYLTGEISQTLNARATQGERSWLLARLLCPCRRRRGVREVCVEGLVLGDDAPK